MSLSKISSVSQSLSLDNPQSKNTQIKQTFDGIKSQENGNQQDYGQKKGQDNDYQCEFKLTVRQKFKQKLKHDQTQDVFTVIINQIIEERIRKNYELEELANGQVPQIATNLQQNQQQLQKQKNGPSQLERLKAEDEQVKNKIKQLLRKRPKKKSLTYQLDPNRDKGFILAKRMNEIKQQRQKKYLQSKKQIQDKKNQIIQSQMSTIACIQNFSMHLALKGNGRYRKESNDYKLPKITQSNNYLNGTQNFNKSKNGFFDFLNKSKSNAVDQISQRMSNQKYQSLTLSARSSYDTKKDKKRDLSRQIQILKKSQKITQKYQLRKIASDLLIDMIFNAVKVVQSKKQFFFNAPPKPVHQMIRNYKDKNGKTVWIPGSKPEKFRINVHLKQLDKQQKSRQQTNEDIEQNVETQKNASRISKISHTFDICINSNNSRAEDKNQQQNESIINESEMKQNNQNEQNGQTQQHQAEKDEQGNVQSEENQSVKQEQQNTLQNEETILSKVEIILTS